MRRHYIWYGLGVGWGIAALAGFVRHHAPQAVPAAVFALLFAVIGLVVSKRDEALRRRRMPKLR